MVSKVPELHVGMSQNKGTYHKKKKKILRFLTPT